MTNKEMEDFLKKLEKKMERSADLEERLEKSWKSVEKFRDSMISKGYSYEMIEEFNKAVSPIQQSVNTIRNLRAKIERAKQALAESEKAEKALREERAMALISGMYMAPKFPYNTDCSNFSFIDGQTYCSVKMDMQYCNDNCPYCTNRSGSYRTDKKGMVVGIRKSYGKRGIR